jgi:hypothetical protein
MSLKLHSKRRRLFCMTSALWLDLYLEWAGTCVCSLPLNLVPPRLSKNWPSRPAPYCLPPPHNNNLLYVDLDRLHANILEQGDRVNYTVVKCLWILLWQDNFFDCIIFQYLFYFSWNAW